MTRANSVRYSSPYPTSQSLFLAGLPALRAERPPYNSVMPLPPGTRLGRIRIDALLGAGGMGEVYRGFDEKLERTVALKVIHSDKRLSAAMRNRFLREARVLSKLDHPNICRIYDVLERDDGDYLVLEYVEGVTLRDRLEQPLARKEALGIALQIARVLAVTHGRGVVHRDLKPDNVMLTPSGQVKVLDFGLARGVLEGERRQALAVDPLDGIDFEKTAVLGRPASSTLPDATHTVAGSLVGTLHYMSPEQASGLPLTEASDIYSLGILMHEMLTGERTAYRPMTTVNTLLVDVRSADVQPFDFRDRALNALVRRTLSLHPADRPRAEDVARELESILGRPARVRRRAIATLAALAIVLTIAGAFVLSQRLGSTRRLFAKNARGKLAILPFRNATGDASLQWIELGLPSLVAEGLGRVKGVTVVPGEDVARAMRNLGLRADTDPSPTQRRALLAALGADVAIVPTVVSDEGKYTIRYAALTPESAESPREATSTVLVEAARQMSTQLAERIDPAAGASVRARYSLDATANTLYAMGIQELRTRGPRVASHYFTVCLDRDPDFVAAKMQLADCLKQTAENARAAQLHAEALARARARGDREMVVQGLILRTNWAVDDGDYPAAERASAEALALARAMGDEELVAGSLRAAGEAQWRRGDLDRAKASFEEALRIYTARGDASSQARMLNNVGLIADSHERPVEARHYWERALAIADRINDKTVAATVIGNLANTYGDTGDLARAETLTRRQLALTRELGDTGNEIFPLVNLGLWLWAQGKEDEAVQYTEEAARVAAKVGNRHVEALILSNLATAYTKLGNLGAARRYNDAALAKAEGLGDPEVERDVYCGLAYTLTREGRLAEARKALDRAERWKPDGRTIMLRGRLAYAEGDYAGAFALIRKAKAFGGAWLIQNEQMYRALEESARTGKPARAVFEGAVTSRTSPASP